MHCKTILNTVLTASKRYPFENLSITFYRPCSPYARNEVLGSLLFAASPAIPKPDPCSKRKLESAKEECLLQGDKRVNASLAHLAQPIPS